MREGRVGEGRGGEGRGGEGKWAGKVCSNCECWIGKRCMGRSVSGSGKERHAGVQRGGA